MSFRLHTQSTSTSTSLQWWTHNETWSNKSLRQLMYKDLHTEEKAMVNTTYSREDNYYMRVNTNTHGGWDTVTHAEKQWLCEDCGATAVIQPVVIQLCPSACLPISWAQPGIGWPGSRGPFIIYVKQTTTKVPHGWSLLIILQQSASPRSH